MTIAQQDYKAGTTAYGTSITATYNSACSVGDALFCCVYQSTASAVAVSSVADSVNSGNWTFLNGHFDSASETEYAWYFKVATAAGTPVVTSTLASGSYFSNIISRFNGFVGTPTGDATVDALGPFAGSGATMSTTGVVTNFNNELLLLAILQGATTAATPTGWTSQDGGTFGNSPTFYAVVPTSGTTNNFSATLGTATPWQIVVAGVYDASSAPPQVSSLSFMNLGPG